MSDSSFIFHVHIKVIKGNAALHLTVGQKNAFRKSMAEKFFGDENPTGKRLPIRAPFS